MSILDNINDKCLKNFYGDLKLELLQNNYKGQIVNDDNNEILNKFNKLLEFFSLKVYGQDEDKAIVEKECSNMEDCISKGIGIHPRRFSGVRHENQNEEQRKYKRALLNCNSNSFLDNKIVIKNIKTNLNTTNLNKLVDELKIKINENVNGFNTKITEIGQDRANYWITNLNAVNENLNNIENNNEIINNTLLAQYKTGSDYDKWLALSIILYIIALAAIIIFAIIIRKNKKNNNSKNWKIFIVFFIVICGAGTLSLTLGYLPNVSNFDNIDNHKNNLDKILNKIKAYNNMLVVCNQLKNL